jgi:FixJ family two-component response regulator
MSVNPIRTVAVVDDDVDVRGAIARLVRSLSYDVREYASGAEFLQSPDLADTACLVTDIRMPNLSGVELHERILQLGFHLPTIFITAFPTPGLKEKMSGPDVIAVLEKPIDGKALAEWIERALGAPLD